MDISEPTQPSPLHGELFQFGLVTPTWLIIPLALLATELFPILFAYIVYPFLPDEPTGGPNLRQHGFVLAFIFACVIAPLVETLTSQWGCLTLLQKKLNVRPWRAIMISAALFASLHCYSWKYVLGTFPIGVIFGYVFVVVQARQGRAFLTVTAVHSLRNAISLAVVFDFL